LKTEIENPGNHANRMKRKTDMPKKRIRIWQKSIFPKNPYQDKGKIKKPVKQAYKSIYDNQGKTRRKKDAKKGNQSVLKTDSL